MTAPDPNPEFDAFAEGYDEALARGLALTGDDKDFYAQARVRHLAQRLAQRRFAAHTILDFGCGTGSAVRFLLETLHPQRIVGTDVSRESLAVARRTFPDPTVHFQAADAFTADGDFDLALTNGVFHHIPPAERPTAVTTIFQSLRPGGLFAFWENNPWNPGTRLVMSRIPFDRDAILVWPRQARRLLASAGFEVVLTDFAFIFPGFLRALRPLEGALRKAPLGGQYMVLARRPE